VHSF